MLIHVAVTEYTNMMNSLASSIFMVFVLYAVLADAAEWTYKGSHGPDKWGDDYPACYGKRQSPIEIEYETSKYDNTLKNVTYIGYENALENSTFTVKNNGHTVVVSIDGPSAYMEDGSLGSRYKLVQFHLHWGAENLRGCEHVLAHLECGAEIHFVHLKDDYTVIDAAALADPEGLAVVGVIIKVETGGEENELYKPLVDKLNDVKAPGSNTTITPFSLNDLLPEDSWEYFRYPGSLTTPPCSEAVIWTVLKNPVVLTYDQWEKFGETFSDENRTPLHDNHRPLQKRGTREVYTNFPFTVEEDSRPNDDDKTSGQSHVQVAMYLIFTMILSIHIA